jgi:hypothetical protein
MSKYRKAIAAFVGFGAFLASRYTGFDGFVGVEPEIVDGIIGLGTVVSVWAFPNAG